jgi:5-methylcytosine-specific restriction endonuclease McrA
VRGHDTTALAVVLAFRNGLTCHLCGQGPDPEDPFEVEHVRPKAAKGRTSLSNLALAHRSCNQVKGTRAVAS